MVVVVAAVVVTIVVVVMAVVCVCARAYYAHTHAMRAWWGGGRPGLCGPCLGTYGERSRRSAAPTRSKQRYFSGRYRRYAG